MYGGVESQCKILFGKADNELDMQNYAKALEYLAEARNIAQNNNLIKEQINALNKTGIIYMKISDYEKAIEYYLEAYQMAIKDPRKYKEEEIYLLNNISNLYSFNNDYVKAKEYVNKAYENAIILQDSLLTGIFAAHLAQITNQTGNLEQAEKYLDIAMVMLKNKNQKNSTSWLFAAKSVRVENLYLKKEYNKAEQLALEIIQNFTDQNLTTANKSIKTECLLHLSRIYLQKKEYQKATDAVTKALNYSNIVKERLILYEQLLRIYLDRDTSLLASKYLDSLLITKDSLAKIANMAQVMNNQIRFELINSEKALAESKAKQKSERMLFIFIILFIIFSVLILILVARMRIVKNKQLKIITEFELGKQTNEKLLLKQEKLLLEQEKLLLEKQLKEQEVLSLLEQQRLNTEIDSKNRQLTTKILFHSSRNELIKEIIHTLTKIPSNSKDPIPILKSVIGKLREQVKESVDSSSLLIHFEQTNPYFLSALKDKHPDLTANEIRLLSYMYLNLDTKEISKLFNITDEYCRKRKQQLSKKMKIPTTEMYRYLTSLG